MAHCGLGLWDNLWYHLAEYFTVASFNLTVPSKEELASPKEIFTERARQCVEVARDLGHDKFHVMRYDLRGMPTLGRAIAAGAAHCPPLEKPDIFYSKLCSFLKEHRFIQEVLCSFPIWRCLICLSIQQ